MTESHDIKGGPRRWVRVLLFVSLALNLLVVGAVTGFVLKGPQLVRGDRADPVLPYTRAFDEDQRHALWRDLRSGLPREGAPLREGYLEDYRTALEILRADPYDPARMEALLAAQAARGAEVRARGQKVLSAYLAAMDPEARRAYADRLEQEIGKMHRRGGGEDRHRGAPGRD
ncbi:periplasmic heavy metal sensor [Maliponia aquimaris]|uniref:Uncharacterized protein n=1 Tax=Maliponia aquimaris TaxID=1673631 RepID=A0A238L351_9RHOB|nr:periplasmic heavy metal sensor [Maliponia aquimaris]SMX49290.1 hypothetical protein MAA8898_04250 [Maliponia aquimaris]